MLSLLGELHIDTQQAVLLWWQTQAVPAGGQEPVAWHLRALLALAGQRMGPVEDLPQGPARLDRLIPVLELWQRLAVALVCQLREDLHATDVIKDQR